jgi:hypothetical protein
VPLLERDRIDPLAGPRRRRRAAKLDEPALAPRERPARQVGLAVALADERQVALAERAIAGGSGVKSAGRA